MMCAHREHRTGNCRICHPPAMNANGPVDPEGPVRVHTDAMPQLWDGDQA